MQRSAWFYVTTISSCHISRLSIILKTISRTTQLKCTSSSCMSGSSIMLLSQYQSTVDVFSHQFICLAWIVSFYTCLKLLIVSSHTIILLLQQLLHLYFITGSFIHNATCGSVRDSVIHLVHIYPSAIASSSSQVDAIDLSDPWLKITCKSFITNLHP